MAICCSVVLLMFCPKPQANTVTFSALTSAAASTDVWNSVLLGAASTVCSPSDSISKTFVAFGRLSSAKICCASSKPSEIEVLCFALISSIPALISDAFIDHGTRVVASVLKDTTEKRAMPSPRK